MKLGKLGSLMKTLTPALQQLGATAAADNMSCLSTLFNDLKDEDDTALAKATTHLKLPAGNSPLLLGDVATTMHAVIELARASGATASRIKALQSAANCVAAPELQKASFADFVEAVKAGFVVDVVALHLNALETSLGTPDFDAAFTALEKDKRVKKPELSAIASRFVSKTPSSAAKKQTMQRIYARHESLVDSENKRGWQKDKSAA